MEVGKDLVEHLARLARLELAAGEADALAVQMREIVGFVERVCELGGAPRRAEDMAPMPLRTDEIRAGIARELTEANAPAWDGGHIVVPPVLPTEDP